METETKTDYELQLQEDKGILTLYRAGKPLLCPYGRLLTPAQDSLGRPAMAINSQNCSSSCALLSVRNTKEIWREDMPNDMQPKLHIFQACAPAGIEMQFDIPATETEQPQLLTGRGGRA